MTQFIIFLIIGVVGIVIGYYLAVSRKAKRVKKNIIAEQGVEKEENLRKLRDYLRALRQAQGKGKDTITNDEVEKLLGVSDATTERYLDDLEKEGILKQEGRTGRFVRYKVL